MSHLSKVFLRRKYSLCLFSGDFLFYRDFFSAYHLILTISIYISYPFEWKTPMGYAICVVIQLITFTATVKLYASILILTIGVCVFIACFPTDIKEKLQQFNEIVVLSEQAKLNAADRVLLAKKLNDIIEFYSETREYNVKFLIRMTNF